MSEESKILTKYLDFQNTKKDSNPATDLKEINMDFQFKSVSLNNCLKAKTIHHQSEITDESNFSNESKKLSKEINKYLIEEKNYKTYYSDSASYIFLDKIKQYLNN